MKVDPIVGAYAQALYQVALAENAVEKVEDELFQVRKMMEGQRDLVEFIRDPEISLEQKKKALSEILGDEVSGITRNHLDFVIDQGRGELIPRIAQAFSAMVFTARNQVVAEVTTAIPLTPELSVRMGKRLSEASGREVVVKNVVDSSILGGVIVRLEDKVINGSVRHSLEELRESLVAAELKE